MTSVGQVPVSLSREVPGFALNRLQYAVLNESVNLVADGLLSAEDLDVVVRHGLGLRYAFMGEIGVSEKLQEHSLQLSEHFSRAFTFHPFSVRVYIYFWFQRFTIR